MEKADLGLPLGAVGCLYPFLRFVVVDLNEISTMTGCLTRVRPRGPREADWLVQVVAVVAAPLTFNSLNKWAAGINDTLALGVLNETLGVDVPIIVAPCVKPTLRRPPAYSESVRRLADAGVTIIDPDAITSEAGDGFATFDWSRIIQNLPLRVS
jgi:phosphopantothenoylcysteine decarboxylase